MSTNQSNNEEVDLGSLFKVIGKGFSNLFKAIGNFFKAILHNIVLFLIFLRNNALKLGIATIIGGGIGLFLDLTKSPVYVSEMIVKPNFKSTQQLYNNVNFYNELVKQKDSTVLAEVLSITPHEASKLKGFYVTPIRNKNEKLELFDEFVQEVDTTTVKNVDIDEFKASFTDFDYKYHTIVVKSELNTIFDKISKPIISSVENNSYFKKQKAINDENLVENEKLLKKSLTEVDTLRNVYNEVLLAEAKKIEQGTNISLAESSNKRGEIELFNQRLNLGKELIENNKDKAETSDILNVVSAFNKVGAKERGVFKKYTFLLAGLFFSLMVLLILLGQLNSFLTTYKK